MIESEKNDNTSEVSSSSTTKATKAKASSVQSDKPDVDLQKLEQAYRCCQGELSRMNKNVQQLQQMKASLEATSFQTSTGSSTKTSADGGGRSNGNSPKIPLQIPIHNHLPIILVKATLREKVEVKGIKDLPLILLVNPLAGQNFAFGAEILPPLNKPTIP